jgi:hypothetical protein
MERLVGQMLKTLGLTKVVMLSSVCLMLFGCRSSKVSELGAISASSNAASSEVSPDHKIGDKLLSISGTSLEQRPVQFSFSGTKRGTIIFVLSPSCSFCRINFHNWRSIRKRTDVDFLWIDVSGNATKRYVKSFGINESDLVVLLDKATSDSLDINATPTTLFVDKSGTIRWIKVGVINDQDIVSLNRVVD